jgi:DNA-binding Lrp family transcriptional regulator
VSHINASSPVKRWPIDFSAGPGAGPAADHRLEVVNVERVGVDVPVPADDVQRVVVQAEALIATADAHHELVLAGLAMTDQLGRRMEVALRVGSMLQQLPVAVAIAVRGLDLARRVEGQAQLLVAPRPPVSVPVSTKRIRPCSSTWETRSREPVSSPPDRTIVALLREDARRSFLDIGRHVHLSAPAVKRRVDRLERDGVLLGYTAVVDPEAFGWHAEAFVDIYCEGSMPGTAIKRAVERESGVISAHTVAGEASALLHVRARDTKDLESALERIRATDGVTRTVTEGVLSTLFQR